jgi:predicted transcriptional regulator
LKPDACEQERRMKLKPTGLKVDRADMDDLQLLATKDIRPLSYMVRLAIKEYLGSRKEEIAALKQSTANASSKGSV